MAMCVIAVVGAAPCQCFSPGRNQTTSPGRISSIWTAPVAAPVRSRRHDQGLAQRMRCAMLTGAGSNVTLAPTTRAGCIRLEQRIDPHRARKLLGRSFAEGCEPLRLMSIF